MVIQKLMALLDTMDRWIDEMPPVDQTSHFGNKAFRTWYAKLDKMKSGPFPEHSNQRCLRLVQSQPRSHSHVQGRVLRIPLPSAA
ncbi:serine/threonine-protein phosphatase 2A activator-like isoform X2 [Xenopus laevis]|uniref:Serine/threonine-protein phosphatase 2A activator n=1 Tax=Xenopus laevis TaxID=8355 RepID=A0A8J1LQU5_XENLA|nr:serine/threonine-protein phosphatase 2A activator-like isoform X2 [Xenopus laevis]